MKKFIALVISIAMVLTMAVPVFADDAYASAKPAKVQNVKVLKNGYNSLKVTWDKIDGAEKYQVYRSTTGKSGSFVLKRTVTGTSYSNTGITCGKTYYYKIRAVNSKGKGVFSAVKSNKVQPSTVKITKVKPPRDMDNKVYWNKVSGATGYQIYRKRADRTTWTLKKTVSAKTTTFYEDYSNSELDYDWEYKVRAYRTVNGKRVYGYFSKPAKWVPDWTIKEIYEESWKYGESLKFPIYEYIKGKDNPDMEDRDFWPTGETYHWHHIDDYGSPETSNWDVLWPIAINRYMTKASIMKDIKGSIECDLSSTAVANPLYWDETGGYDEYYGDQDWHEAPGWSDLQNFGIYYEKFRSGYKLWLLW